MIPKYFLQSLFLTTLMITAACKSKPIVLEEDTSTNAPEIKPMESATTTPNMHKIKVVDFQHTTKYTYVHVIEDAKSYCVAIPKTTDIKIGNEYFFKGGIVMANPEKLKFKEVFESVMIAPGFNESAIDEKNAASSDLNTTVGKISINKEIKIIPAPGVIKLEELITNAAKYNGKQIKVQGQCVKVNQMILNKNWIHIQDHTKNKAGDPYDLTITTQDQVNIGDIVVFEGILAVNKDFGSGYKYDLILEEAKLK